MSATKLLAQLSEWDLSFSDPKNIHNFQKKRAEEENAHALAERSKATEAVARKAAVARPASPPEIVSDWGAALGPC
ncbi:MAG: hypothetical protein P0S96_02675 [Simkaniaceae bacterium]|nr:hypothetical protein [Candidatus Sacchlamyda saccharinae]